MNYGFYFHSNVQLWYMVGGRYFNRTRQLKYIDIVIPLPLIVLLKML